MSFLAARNSPSITNATMTSISDNGIDVATSSSSSSSSSSSFSSSLAATTITNVNVSGTCTFSAAAPTATSVVVSAASCLSSTQQEEYLQQQQQYQIFQQQQQQQQHHHKYNYYQPPPAVGNSQHFSTNNNVGDVATSASSAATTYNNSLATTSTAMATTTSTTSATSLATFNGNSNLENGAAISNGNNNNNNNNNNFNSNYNNGNSINSSSTTNATSSSDGGSSNNKINSTPPPVAAPFVVAGNFIIGHKTDAASSSSTVGTNSTSALKMQQQQQQQQLQITPEDFTSLGGPPSFNGQILINNNNHLSTNNAIITAVNGGGNSSSSNNPNLNGILKGSKENLLQNNYCNGSAGGSTSGSEGIGSGPLNIPEHDDPGDGLGPLPPKWETAYTERGELYFIDHNTGTSHWLDPRLSKYQKKSLEECGEDELPYGWEKIEDSLYGTYYIDHVNRKTQYENPVLEAKRRAAEQKQHQQQQQQQHQHLHSHQHQHQQQHQLPPQRPQTPSSSSVLNGANASIALGSVSSASTLSTVDISQRAMQPTPAMAQEQNANKPPLLPYKFTRNPAEMQGQRITTTLLKSARGLGITIVGGDDGVEEFLQIKSIVPNGPAWLDGQLQMGDVLVYVNDTCVLGFTHHEMVNVFQSIMPGESVTLEVCRGYSLPFDPNDPNTEVVTTIAVDGISAHEPDKQRRMLMDINMDGNYNFLDISGNNSTGGNKHILNAGSAIDNSGFILMKKPEVHSFSIIKGAMGFGFTIADSSYGQKVKKILDRACCHQLQEGDILLEINDIVVRNKSHMDVVQILKDCSKTEPTLLKIQRPVASTTTANGTSPNSSAASSGGNNTVAKLRKNFLGATTGGIGNNALFRSKTPTADLYSTMQKEVLPIRPKTPLVDTRRTRVNTPNIELNEDREVAAVNTSAEQTALERSLAESKTLLNEGNKSQNSLSEIDAINNDIPFMDPYPKMVTSLSERLAGVSLPSDALLNNGSLGPTVGGYLRTTASGVPNYENQGDYVSASSGNFSSIYGLAQMPPVMSPLSGGLYGPPATTSATTAGLIPPSTGSYHHHHESCYCYECQDFRNNRLRNTTTTQNLQPPTHQHQQPSPRSYYPVYHPPQHGHSQYSPASSASLQAAHIQNERMQKRVNELLNDRRRAGFSPLDHQHHNQMQIHTGIGGSTVSGGGGGYSPSQQQYLHQHSSHGILNHHQQQHSPAPQQVSNWPNNAGFNINTLQPTVGLMRNGFPESGDILDGSGEQFVLSEVTLQRQALGFGFRIVGGTEEGSQVTVGHIVPGGAADNDHRITTGDEILSIDGINVVNSSHHKVVSLMGEAALRGQVTMILRRRMRPGMPQSQMQPQLMVQQSMLNTIPISTSGGGMLQHTTPLQPLLRNNPARYPYDVIVTRHENEGFGFVIISSSNQYYGSTIGKLIPGSPADRCGELKVGDRIIAVNRIDIAGMSHGDVVNLIKESGLHVRLTIGCPKEGAIINAAPTMPAGSGINATSGIGVGNSGLLLNSAQASPGQVSQTLTPTLQTNLDPITQYFERPLLSGGSNAGSATSSTSQHMQPAQQSPNPLPVPPQL